MKNFILFLFLITSILFAQQKTEEPAYLDYNLPVKQRVDDLVSRMALAEKVSQMENSAKAIPRLDVPEYNWWNEALHGVARAGTATVFPQAIGLAATWDTDLMFEVADVISTEARAKHNHFLKNGDRGQYKGLTFWSPNINIFRDPRWGRGQETYGEDPYLTSRMGVQFVKGMQGDDPKYLKLVATPKHYAVHSGPEPDRHTFNAITDNIDLYETYLSAFEAVIKEAGAYSVMCAYNRYMGEACCGSPPLLKKILRSDWGFEGYVVSDCGAIRDIYANHKIIDTAPEAAAQAVKAGTDLNCGYVYADALIKAADQKLITEDEIDTAVKRLFTARFKLGMFDPPEMVKYSQIPYSENDSEEHRNLALKAARESIVLLKNEKNTLPLKKDIKKIAVIGPTADSYEMLVGNYNGIPSKYVTPLQGIKNKVKELPGNAEVNYEQGCNLVGEGAIVYNLTSDLLSSGGKKGIKTEYFRDKNFEGEPFFSGVLNVNARNWAWNREVQIPNWRDGFAIRFTGKYTPEVSGKHNFTLKGNDGYRLFIDDNLILEDWTEHEYSSRSGVVDLEGGKSYDIKVEYFVASGRPDLKVQWELLNIDYFNEAVELAVNSDAVIFVGGITAELEGEEKRVDYPGFDGGDRTNLKLPEVQEDLLKALHSTGKPVILVLTSGSALAVNRENENLPAIVQLWYPGEEGGTALADVLFGDYNPGGRVPVTFYKSVEQLPPFDDYNMNGRTYKYFEGVPLYPFGYGLSYTKFEYENLVLPEKLQAGESVTVSVDVINTGTSAGDEVVQLYVKDEIASVRVPLQSLEGFKRIFLRPGQKETVDFIIAPKQFSVIKPKDINEVSYIIEPGKFVISAGGILPGFNVPSTGSVSKTLEITGADFTVE